MEAQEFYDYIIENFNLDGTACRLVRNIIEYIEDQEFIDAEDAHAHLNSLLGRALGLEEREIKMYRADPCEICGKYIIDQQQDYDDAILCPDCRKTGKQAQMFLKTRK